MLKDKTILFIDLDNTIYPVSSIGEKLFAPILRLFDEFKEELGDSNYQGARQDLMRKPFQHVATQYHFPGDLLRRCMEVLRNVEYIDTMHPYPDYPVLAAFPARKFLVTTGFTKLQLSKVKQLGISMDFEEIIINDPELRSVTKKDIFIGLIRKHNLNNEDILIIGDDLDSEIKAGRELGIDTLLYDPLKQHADADVRFTVHNYNEIESLHNS